MKRSLTVGSIARTVVIGAVLLLSLSCDSGSGNPLEAPPFPPPSGDTNGTEELNYIFTSGTQGYECFRIPAIVKTNAGTLLAFAEARKHSCSDEGNIDLVLKRSTDGGETWGEMIMVWDEGANTAGNPAPVVDRRTGTIHLLMTWNLGTDDIGEINRGTSGDTRRVFLTHSTDDGVTWTEPEEITSSVKKPQWGWYATGPGHGIQIHRGEHEGRLIIACDYIEVGPGRQGYSHVIYSDDGGASWQLGGIAPEPGGNESTVAELSDGRLLLNMRSSGPVRLIAFSSDGGKSWSNMQMDHELVEPTCQASLLSYQADSTYMLFFSNPASTTRENMTIKLSTDDGNTWTQSYTVYEGPSAYSDLVIVIEGQLGILYEAGEESPYEGIVWETISLDEFE